MIRVSRVLHSTEAEGPGRRTAVWFQGCSIRCAGCINPQLFSPTGGYETSIDEIIQNAVAAGDEGLTLLGGEPFDQPESLLLLAQAAQNHELGVICFTGHEFSTLKIEPSNTNIWDVIDLLVDGPYRRDAPENVRPLVGSTNQSFIYLTDRYKYLEHKTNKNRLEIRISPEGNSEISGFLKSDQLRELTFVTKSLRQKRNF